MAEEDINWVQIQSEYVTHRAYQQEEKVTKGGIARDGKESDEVIDTQTTQCFRE